MNHADADKMIITNKVSFGKKGLKYFIEQTQCQTKSIAKCIRMT